MTTDQPVSPSVREPIAVRKPDGTLVPLEPDQDGRAHYTADQPGEYAIAGVSPLKCEHGEFSERRLAEIAERLGIGAETAAALEATARDLATTTSAPPETILEALGKTLAPEPAVAFRLRIRGVPYLAETPIAGSPPGYRLHPDRRQRHLDRAARALRPSVWTAPAGTLLPRPVDAPGCHPAYRLLTMLDPSA